MRSTIVDRLRVGAATILAMALLAMSAGGVAAGKPDKEPLDAPPLEFAAGDVCDFPLLIETTANKEQLKTFYDRDGNAVRQILTGKLRTLVTNLTTMETFAANTSGPGKFIPNAARTLTVIGGGPWLTYLFPSDVTGAALWLTKGRIRLEFDADFNVYEAALPHNATDVCELLAS